MKPFIDTIEKTLSNNPYWLLVLFAVLLFIVFGLILLLRKSPATKPISPAKTWSAGLLKTRKRLEDDIISLFKGRKSLDSSQLEKLHETLYRADIGVKTVDKLIKAVEASGPHTNYQTIYASLKKKSLELLLPQSLDAKSKEQGPQVILTVGVNGVGKTTTIAKLAEREAKKGKKVLVAAADTYRAAEFAQLNTWEKRLDIPIIAHKEGSDPAAVAYDAVNAALARNIDTLLIDTAGRLHSHNNLMDELAKIKRVILKKIPDTMALETFLILDATSGQNVFSQVRIFQKTVQLTGLIVTKVDGSSKAGALLGISDEFKLPIRFVGMGESASDLKPFEPTEFVNALFSAPN